MRPTCPRCGGLLVAERDINNKVEAVRPAAKTDAYAYKPGLARRYGA